MTKKSDIETGGKMDGDIVKKNNEEAENTAAYEEARKSKRSDKDPDPVPDEDVESANNRINPDSESMKSRG